MPPTRSTRSRTLAPETVAAGITVVVDLAYVVLVMSQHDGFTARHLFISLHLLVIAGVLVAGTRAQGPVARAGLLAGAANSLILVGFLGLFSIGLPLLIAGLMTMPALARVLSSLSRPMGPAVVGLATLIAAAIMIGGLLATT